MIGNDNLEGLLERGWPFGVPREEVAIAAGLDDKHASIAQRRLESLLAYEAGADWQLAARHAGLDRTSFFELASAWRVDRSLASIVPRVRAYRTTRRPHEAIREHVTAALRETPDAARRTLAEIVRLRMPVPAGLTTIEGVIDSVRLGIERNVLGGTDGVGRRVVVDVCPGTMRILGAGEDAGHAIAWTGFVVDVATTTVFGSSASGSAIEAMRMACLRAASRVDALKGGGSTMPVLEVHPEVEGNAVELLRETGRLRELGYDVHPSTGRRSNASRVSALLNRKYGPVTLKARLDVPTSCASPVGNRMSDAEMMDARIDAEAERQWKQSIANGLKSAVSPRLLAKALRSITGRSYDES